MNDIINNSYNYELVDDDLNNTKYDFVSLGNFEIPKRVSIRPIGYGFYNLGFGDLTINENGEEKVDDKPKNVNVTDGDKILNTALLCSVDFMVRNNGTKIVFYGNTILKHRLYKMRICGKLMLVNDYFNINGGIIENVAIIADDEGFKDLEKQIDPNQIRLETFNTSNCNLYNFITFDIKQQQ